MENQVYQEFISNMVAKYGEERGVSQEVSSNGVRTYFSRGKIVNEEIAFGLIHLSVYDSEIRPLVEKLGVDGFKVVMDPLNNTKRIPFPVFVYSLVQSLNIMEELLEGKKQSERIERLDDLSDN